MFISGPLLHLCHENSYEKPLLRDLHNKLLALGAQEKDINKSLLQALEKLENHPSQLSQSDFENILWPFGQKLLKDHALIHLFDKAFSAGKDLEGKLEILWLIAEHQLKATSDHNEWNEFCEFEFLASGLCDREPQVGLHITLPERPHKIWRVDWSHCESGAFIWVLRPVADLSQAIIVCRGTALRWRATQGFQSGLNDLLPKMGSWGFKSIWPSLRQWLTSESVKQVEVMGKSLGGTISQMVATAILHDTCIHVRNVHTLQSAGTDHRVHQIFERVLSSATHSISMQITRWNVHFNHLPVDLVPFLGGYHLGHSPESKRPSGLIVRNVHIGDEGSHQKVSTNKIVQFFQLTFGLATTHAYQVRLLKEIPSIKTELLDESNKTGSLLPVVEPLRQVGVDLLSLTTPFIPTVIKSCFEQAIQSDKKPRHQMIYL